MGHYTIAIAGHRAHPQLARTLRQHQMHGPLPLQLQAQSTLEFQCSREQHTGRGCLAQRIADGLGIAVMLHQRAPRRIHVDDVAADGIVLEQETMQAIAIVHGLRSYSLRTR
jgi:hypothetical protein